MEKRRDSLRRMRRRFDLAERDLEMCKWMKSRLSMRDRHGLQTERRRRRCFTGRRARMSMMTSKGRYAMDDDDDDDDDDELVGGEIEGC
ncbi:hypothetical protein TIFTF001_006073 [Ficus carica]|uniref:Uncharacterized protein n=1 Tax=Ficus carica TaxID=3494 RepID=A0AA87ZN68_FICCA|nr:hypothetical protein TIFTF001_006073 [Ficus carica]